MAHPRRASALAALLFAHAALIGCAGAGEPAAAPEPTSNDRSREPIAEHAEENMSHTPIRIIVDGQSLEARLWDNPAAQSLIDQLPLTLDFSDYGGQEVLAELWQPLAMDGMPSGESAPAGTIGYYAPDRAMVLYYSDVGRFNGIVRIGEINGDLSILRDWSTPRPVTLELVD